MPILFKLCTKKYDILMPGGDNMQYANFEKEAKTFNDDESISEWAKEGVSLLSSEGILVGRENGEFDPLTGVTRAEAAKIIYESLKLIGGADVEA